MLKPLVYFNFFVCVVAIFAPDTKVLQLNSQNFGKYVLKSDRVWIVKFYVPWCGYCQSFGPEFDRSAKALSGVVRLGAVNVENEKELAAKYGVNSYPTVKIFIVDKNKPEEFRGERNANTLVNAAMSAVQRKVNHQLSGKPDRGPDVDFKDVVKLTDNNFRDMVLNSKDMWMINFYAPWCKTCQKFEPVWAEAATELKGKVRLGALDITLNKLTSDHYNIRKYPTVKYFPPGYKNEIFDYKFKRTKQEIVEFALKQLLDSKPPPKIKQITNYNSFKNVCAEEQLCVISFLPHLLDCQSKCRRSYLKTLKEVGKKFREKAWGWVWSEAGSQMELENALEVGGFGYPAMVVVNVNKMKCTVLRGAFSEDGISEFLRDLSYGRGSVTDLKSEIVIVDITPWDGKDAKEPNEEYEASEETKENEEITINDGNINEVLEYEEQLRKKDRRHEKIIVEKESNSTKEEENIQNAEEYEKKLRKGKMGGEKITVEQETKMIEDEGNIDNKKENKEKLRKGKINKMKFKTLRGGYEEKLRVGEIGVKKIITEIESQITEDEGNRKNDIEYEEELRKEKMRDKKITAGQEYQSTEDKGNKKDEKGEELDEKREEGKCNKEEKCVHKDGKQADPFWKIERKPESQTCRKEETGEEKNFEGVDVFQNSDKIEKYEETTDERKCVEKGKEEVLVDEQEKLISQSEKFEATFKSQDREDGRNEQRYEDVKNETVKNAEIDKIFDAGDEQVCTTRENFFEEELKAIPEEDKCEDQIKYEEGEKTSGIVKEERNKDKAEDGKKEIKKGKHADKNQNKG